MSQGLCCSIPALQLRGKNETLDVDVVEVLHRSLKPAWDKWEEFRSHFDVEIEVNETNRKVRTQQHIMDTLRPKRLEKCHGTFTCIRISSIYEPMEKIGLEQKAEEWLKQRGQYYNCVCILLPTTTPDT